MQNVCEFSLVLCKANIKPTNDVRFIELVLHGVKSIFLLLFGVRKGSLRLMLENVLCQVLPHVIRDG